MCHCHFYNSFYQLVFICLASSSFSWHHPLRRTFVRPVFMASDPPHFPKARRLFHFAPPWRG